MVYDPNSQPIFEGSRAGTTEACCLLAHSMAPPSAFTLSLPSYTNQASHSIMAGRGSHEESPLTERAIGGHHLLSRTVIFFKGVVLAPLNNLPFARAND